MIRLPRAAVWLCCLLAVAACSRPNTGGAPPSGGSAPVRVVATTTVFADFVKSVGGDRVDVVSLVPKGGDVHTFDPRPTDITAVADAQLVVANGLGLLTEAAMEERTRVPKDQYIVEDGIPNPHLWLDPDDAALYATTIRDALKALDPADGAVFDANTTAYQAKLAELRKWGQELVATVPPDQRQLIAFHDALPYFARTYGFKIAGVILRAPGQDPSASDIAALVKAIRDNHIQVVVSEVQFSDKLAKTIADETWATIVSDLYDDSLGDAPVDSYDALVRYDIQQLVNAMKGGG